MQNKKSIVRPQVKGKCPDLNHTKHTNPLRVWRVSDAFSGGRYLGSRSVTDINEDVRRMKWAIDRAPNPFPPHDAEVTAHMIGLEGRVRGQLKVDHWSNTHRARQKNRT